MEPMNFTKAVNLIGNDIKFIERKKWNGTLRIQFINGECYNANDGRVTLILEDYLATDWQPWEEPREYFHINNVLSTGLINQYLQHENFIKKDRAWFLTSRGEIKEEIFETGTVRKIEFVPVEFLSPKWYYIVTPTASENDSTDEIQEPIQSKCFKCGRLGILDDNLWRCPNYDCRYSWDAALNKSPEEPVFDLTYKQLIIDLYLKHPSEKAQAECFHKDFYWFLRDGKWYTMYGLPIDKVQLPLKSVKWRIVQ